MAYINISPFEDRLRYPTDNIMGYQFGNVGQRANAPGANWGWNAQTISFAVTSRLQTAPSGTTMGFARNDFIASENEEGATIRQSFSTSFAQTFISGSGTESAVLSSSFSTSSESTFSGAPLPSGLLEFRGFGGEKQGIFVNETAIQKTLFSFVDTYKTDSKLHLISQKDYVKDTFLSTDLQTVPCKIYSFSDQTITTNEKANNTTSPYVKIDMYHKKATVYPANFGTASRINWREAGNHRWLTDLAQFNNFYTYTPPPFGNKYMDSGQVTKTSTAQIKLGFDSRMTYTTLTFSFVNGSSIIGTTTGILEQDNSWEETYSPFDTSEVQFPYLYSSLGKRFALVGTATPNETSFELSEIKVPFRRSTHYAGRVNLITYNPPGAPFGGGTPTSLDSRTQTTNSTETLSEGITVNGQYSAVGRASIRTQTAGFLKPSAPAEWASFLHRGYIPFNCTYKPSLPIYKSSTYNIVSTNGESFPPYFPGFSLFEGVKQFVDNLRGYNTFLVSAMESGLILTTSELLYSTTSATTIKFASGVVAGTDSHTVGSTVTSTTTSSYPISSTTANLNTTYLTTYTDTVMPFKTNPEFQKKSFIFRRVDNKSRTRLMTVEISLLNQMLGNNRFFLAGNSPNEISYSFVVGGRNYVAEFFGMDLKTTLELFHGNWYATGGNNQQAIHRILPYEFDGVRSSTAIRNGEKSYYQHKDVYMVEMFGGWYNMPQLPIDNIEFERPLYLTLREDEDGNEYTHYEEPNRAVRVADNKMLITNQSNNIRLRAHTDNSKTYQTSFLAN